MNLFSRILFLIILSSAIDISAQFKFSGEASEEFNNSKAYLVIIDDYKKGNLFLTNQILQETTINENGFFVFSGEFLSQANKLYKIYIDQCNDEITNANHLLKHCDLSNSIQFIANGTDAIHFALNDINQMFCSFQSTSPQNLMIHKIDSVQEVLLANLQSTKSDAQRNVLFKNYFKELQTFSFSLEEPLAELYSYYLYANNESFTREMYLIDLEDSDYYLNLLNRLTSKYPNSSYVQNYEADLIHDNSNATNNSSSFLISTLIVVLILSLGLNFYFIQKNRVKSSKVNYKEVLSTQEQNVFELMIQGLSNKEIADQLFVSLSTIKSHINNIYSKLSINSRKEISRFS